jgi:SAM-dependent methyltransferase
VTARYAFPNAWELAQRRLELLEACHDPSSFRRAERLGVGGSGWRCLDVGAGHGSFARWLAGRVGEGGSVVAADLDVRLLERIEMPRLEVRRMDVVRDPLEQGAFDFVHTRLLLIHLPSRFEVLARLAAALRPGGVLMIEEDDVYPVWGTATGAYREGWKAFLAATGAAGVDAEWARTLPERLEALGLAGVDGEVHAQFFRGGSEPAQFWSLTWLQLRDRMPAEVVERGLDALEDETRWYHGPAKVIAWGRRPIG